MLSQMLRMITHTHTLPNGAVAVCAILALRKGLLLGSESILLVLLGFTISAFIQGIVSIGLHHGWSP
jgi:hypothetical protein